VLEVVLDAVVFVVDFMGNVRGWRAVVIGIEARDWSRIRGSTVVSAGQVAPLWAKMAIAIDALRRVGDLRAGSASPKAPFSTPMERGIVLYRDSVVWQPLGTEDALWPIAFAGDAEPTGPKYTTKSARGWRSPS
jgi:hypothetical protein